MEDPYGCQPLSLMGHPVENKVLHILTKEELATQTELSPRTVTHS